MMYDPRDDRIEGEPDCYCGGWQGWLEDMLESLALFMFDLFILVLCFVAVLFLVWIFL